MALRQGLDLYANVRPCRRYPGVPSLYDDVDVVVVRENTEGMYTGIEFEMGTPAAAELIGFIGDRTGRRGPSRFRHRVKDISEFGSERIVRFAFDWARDARRHAGHRRRTRRTS